MNEAALRNEIQDDLRESPGDTVIYLEGKSDPAILFALLGLPNPPDGLHRGVFVKGLKGDGARRGSGSNAVAARIELATRLGLRGIFGVVDGDGRTLDELRLSFDPPYLGPLFSWKAYCIENLLAKSGWPLAWGAQPNWNAELTKYGPNVALNRIGLEVRSILRALGLEKYTGADRLAARLA